KPQGALQGASHGQVAMAPVGAIDDGPGRLARSGALDDLFADTAIGGVVFEELPVALDDPPALAGVGLELPETLLLGRARQVQPVLEDQDALAMEHLLQRDDPIERPVELERADASERAVDQRLGIPGAEEDADAPAGRQLAPVAPHRRMPQLVVSRRP